MLHNRTMPNIANVLKAEVTRLTRKEARALTEALRTNLLAARADIAALKRRVAELEKAQAKASRAAARSPTTATDTRPPAEDVHFRFRPAGMASNRKRLGLSAADFGLLVGATGQSVYAWEQRKSRPSGKHLEAIAALRGIGKQEAARRLDVARQAAGSA